MKDSDSAPVDGSLTDQLDELDIRRKFIFTLAIETGIRPTTVNRLMLRALQEGDDSGGQ